ncbi:hypothetical protein RDI58_026844 [Solanum bulbocastanum]|uniref:Uncharacterized protein n=1 Tax=Solanum bulbocastanum TaxID=147425 RepID=A0AAN8Y3Q5_SOLBU
MGGSTNGVVQPKLQSMILHLEASSNHQEFKVSTKIASKGKLLSNIKGNQTVVGSTNGEIQHLLKFQSIILHLETTCNQQEFKISTKVASKGKLLSDIKGNRTVVGSTNGEIQHLSNSAFEISCNHQEFKFSTKVASKG